MIMIAEQIVQADGKKPPPLNSALADTRSCLDLKTQRGF
jgi:hypothetical protein